MKKLLILIHSLDGGGAERVVWRLSNYWATQQGLDVHIAVMKPRFAYAALNNVQIHVLGQEQPTLAGKLLEQPFLISRFRKLVKSLQPDAVLALMPRSNVLAAMAKDCLKPGARLVLSERTSFDMQYSGLSRLLIGAAYRTLYPLADAIITVSQGVAGELTCRGVPAAKVHAIPNPCDIGELHELAGRAVPTHPWLADSAVPVFLSVGRLAPEKDFKSLLRAFALVAEQRTARLLIMGKGPLENELRAEISRLGLDGRAELVPFSSNPFPSIRQAFAYVLSSRAEGFPNALMEAMALGKPCVAFDCKTGPSELMDGRDCGLLVRPQGDSRALARALLILLDSPSQAAAMGQRAARRTEEFSLPLVASRYEQLLFNR